MDTLIKITSSSLCDISSPAKQWTSTFVEAKEMLSKILNLSCRSIYEKILSL